MVTWVRVTVLSCQDFAVAPAWILDQWQSGKIDHEMAIEELVRCRGRGLLNGISLVEGVRARQKVLDLKIEIEDVQDTLFNQMNLFRGHSMVENRIMQYHEDKYNKS